jgi:hypothetical protein
MNLMRERLFLASACALLCFLPRLAFADADPLLVDAVGTSTNGNVDSGNGFVVYLPQPTLAGNTVICGMSYPYSAHRTVNVKDDKSDNWTEAVSVTNGTEDTQAIYYAANVAAGAVKLTFTFDADIFDFQVACKEAYGIVATAPLDGTASSANVMSGAVSAGPMTTTQDGDLIVQYGNSAGNDLPFNNQTITSFTAGTGFSKIVADTLTGQFFQDIQQAHAGAITPSFVAESSGNPYGTVAAAFKTMAGAGTPPPGSGIHIDHEWTFCIGNVAPTVYFPSTGNFVTIAITDVGNSFTITDSEHDSYKQNEPTNGNLLYYTALSAPTPDLTISLTNVGCGNTEFVLRDIRNVDTSDPIDTAATNGGPQMSYTPGTMIPDAPTITPAAAGELILLAQANGCGPPLGVTSPAGVINDSVWFNGEVDADFFDSGEGHAHFLTTSTAPISFTWTMENPACPAQGGNSWSATAWAIKPGSSPPPPPMDGGADSGPGADGSTSSDAGSRDGSVSAGDASSGADSGRSGGSSGSSSGCSCTTAARRSLWMPHVLLGLVLSLWVVRRRRAR